jgi:hypothetical protein
MQFCFRREHASALAAFKFPIARMQKRLDGSVCRFSEHLGRGLRAIPPERRKQRRQIACAGDSPLGAHAAPQNHVDQHPMASLLIAMRTLLGKLLESVVLNI